VNVKLMTMLFRKLGYELLVAANGREVLELLEAEAAKGRQHEVECILMDASMDVMDGIECTRVIRAHQMQSRTRPWIIGCTANVTEEHRAACLQAGMDDFVPKPIDVTLLVNAIKAAYRNGKRQADSSNTQSSSAAASTSSAGDKQ